MAKILLSPEDETPCPFPERLLRRDESLRGWEENPLFVAFVRRRAYEGKRSDGTLTLLGALVAVGCVVLGSLAAMFVIGRDGLYLLIILPVLFILASGLSRQQSAKLPRTLNHVLRAPPSPSNQALVDVWMTGNGGRVLAEATYLELRATGASLLTWFPCFLVAALLVTYFWMHGLLWPWDLLPVAALSYVALSVTRSRTLIDGVLGWVAVEDLLVQGWELESRAQPPWPTEALRLLVTLLACALPVLPIWLLYVWDSHAGEFLSHHVDAHPWRLEMFIVATGLSFGAGAFLMCAVWVFRSREATIRERVLRRAEYAWDHYVVTRVLDPSEDARRWSAERHKAWEAAAAEDRKA